MVASGCVAAFVVLGEKPVYEAHAAVESSALMPDGDGLILQAARKAGLQGDAEFNQPAGNASLVSHARGHLSFRNDGQLVQVSFRAFDAGRAAAFANALVDGYRDEVESRGLAKAVELSSGLEALQALIDEKEARIAEGSLSGKKLRVLIEDANRQRGLYDAMLMRASVPMSTPGQRFVERARVPAEAMNANPWAGLMLGAPLVLLSASLCFLAWRRLKQVPAVPAELEVMCSQEDIEKPVVAVASAGTGFVNPETLVDYVENLLGGGNRVLIVDCAVGGALTDSVGLRGEFGFTDFVLESPALRGAMPAWKTNREGVWVMPAGTRPNRIPVLLSGSALRGSLAVLLVEFDRVVINGPAILSTGEMRDLSRLVDGVIVVAPQERSRELAQLAVRQVEEFGGRVIGLVEDAGQLAVF